MKLLVFLSFAVTLLGTHCKGQIIPSTKDTVVYQLVKGVSPSIVFHSNRNSDTIAFEAVKKVSKSIQPTPVLKIKDGSHLYNVSTYFTGFGYDIINATNDSIIVTYRDMPYGELIIEGLSKTDLINNNLKVNRLDCVVNINGVKGIPTLDLGEKTIDTEKLKKPPLKELLITNFKGDKVFCSAERKFSEKAHTNLYTLKFNMMNSQKLNERLKLTALFVFWLYEKQ